MSGRQLRYILGGATLGALVGAAYAYMLSSHASPFAVFNSPVTVPEPEYVPQESPE